MDSFSSVVLSDRRFPGGTEHIADSKNDLLFSVWLI